MVLELLICIEAFLKPLSFHLYKGVSEWIMALLVFRRPCDISICNSVSYIFDGGVPAAL